MKGFDTLLPATLLNSLLCYNRAGGGSNQTHENSAANLSPTPPLQLLLPFQMLQIWQHTALTFLQVIQLARAIPRPQSFGQSSRIPSILCLKVSCPSALRPTTNEKGLTHFPTVTLVDANLQLQVVTSTDLPPVQIPTSTSAIQSWPDTSGVSSWRSRTLH